MIKRVEDRFEIVAPAKINLYIKITGKRPDGYHTIESVFLPLKNPCDIISFTPTIDGWTVSSSEPELPENEKNLCGQAITEYAKIAEMEFGSKLSINWAIHIEKHIPVSAGMGGGSSDAAAVLSFLQNQYQALPQKRLFELALSLGADIPFFLNPCPALAKGVGEELKPIEVASPGPPILIIAPEFPISAAWAYTHSKWRENPQNEKNDCLERLLAALKEGDWAECANNLFNDLAPAAFHKFPLLEILRQDLLDAGALGVEMTGSGPTLFAICESQEKLATLATKMREKYQDQIGIVEAKQ